MSEWSSRFEEWTRGDCLCRRVRTTLHDPDKYLGLGECTTKTDTDPRCEGEIHKGDGWIYRDYLDGRLCVTSWHPDC